jgi:hypothetical protein
MDLDICFSGGFIQFNDTSEKTVYFENINNSYFNTNEKIRKLIPKIICRSTDKNDIICGSTCMSMYNTEFLRKNGLIFISEKIFISEDYWFNMDCLDLANKINYSDVIGYYYRYNTNSLTRSYNPNRFSHLSNSISMLLDKCEQMELRDYYDRVAMYFWINFEKCFNQEIRLNKKNCIHKIEEMCTTKMSQQMLYYLSDKKVLNSLHTLLCRLLYKKQYKIVIFLMSFYNKMVHGE